MRAPFARRKVAFLTAAVLASAGASTLMFSGVTPQISAKAADLLSMMHSRSPGARPAGAKSNKHKHSAVLAQAAPAKPRVSHVLPAAVPAATPAAAAPPLAGAATPIPAALAPVALPAAMIPAAASSSGLFIPPIFIPGGGGGGGVVIVPSSNPPPGGGNPPPPVPGVPEPSTWAMMLLGFLFVGGLMRRRQQLEQPRTVRADSVPSAR